MDFEQGAEKIVETLKAAVPSLGTVEAYAGQLEGELEGLPLRFPAAFVLYGGSHYEWVDGPTYRETVGYSVMVAARSPKGRAQSRETAYALVKDVLAALAGRDLDLPMERLRPVRTALVFTSGTATVYGLDFETGFDTAYAW
jgi:phage gp37-like protein